MAPLLVWKCDILAMQTLKTLNSPPFTAQIRWLKDRENHCRPSASPCGGRGPG